MDTNTATVVIAAFTMITSITTGALAYYTNRRTKRIEQNVTKLTLDVIRQNRYTTSSETDDTTPKRSDL